MSKWSWKLGHLFGIDIYVHATFFLLLGWIMTATIVTEHSLSAAIASTLFVLLIFAIVVMHEFGHALTARKFGIRTRDIVLLPIGGVARLERMPREPLQEFYVAIAGPLVNVALALSIFVIGSLSGISFKMARMNADNPSFLQSLFWINVVLAGFNLIPAFPMDGGRVLRAYLATKMPYMQATDTAARIGQGMALIFAFVGFFINPWLIIIAVFIWLGAEQEAMATRLQGTLEGVPVERAMIKDLKRLSPDDPLKDAVTAILSGFQHDFPVMDTADNLIGILTRSGLVHGLERYGLMGKVRYVMHQDFIVSQNDEMLVDALEKLKNSPCHTLAVMKNNKLAGIVTMENLTEFMMIDRALEGRLKAS